MPHGNHHTAPSRQAPSNHLHPHPNPPDHRTRSRRTRRLARAHAALSGGGADTQEFEQLDGEERQKYEDLALQDMERFNGEHEAAKKEKDAIKAEREAAKAAKAAEKEAAKVAKAAEREAAKAAKEATKADKAKKTAGKKTTEKTEKKKVCLSWPAVHMRRHAVHRSVPAPDRMHLYVPILPSPRASCIPARCIPAGCYPSWLCPLSHPIPALPTPAHSHPSRPLSVSSRSGKLRSSAHSSQ